MSDFDVHTNGMNKRRLSDADAEALIAGRRVEGAPPGLDAMLSTMRERAESGPSVPISAALSEFIIDGNPSAIASDAAPLSSSPRRFRTRAKRAAAVLAVVPAKILIGASMAAAAAVGGAQAFGVVDLPLLPGPAPQVVIPTPVEIVPPTVDDRPVISPPTPPTQARVDGTSGCEYEQEGSPRPNATRPTAVPSIDTCETDAPARIDRTPSTTDERTPVDPTTGDDAPASGTDDNGEHPDVEAPAEAPDDHSGDVTGGGGPEVSVPEPNPDHASNADSSARDLDSDSITNPPSDSGEGRTPSDD